VRDAHCAEAGAQRIHARRHAGEVLAREAPFQDPEHDVLHRARVGWGRPVRRKCKVPAPPVAAGHRFGMRGRGFSVTAGARREAGRIAFCRPRCPRAKAPRRKPISRVEGIAAREMRRVSARDHIAVVCKDCGELGHYPTADLKPGKLLSCQSCGLVTDAAHFLHVDVTLALRTRFGGGETVHAGFGRRR